MIARVEDRSTQECVHGCRCHLRGQFSYFLDAMLYQSSLQELNRFGEDGFFVVVAVEQQIMDFCTDRGTGMLQIVRKEVVSGNVQRVGDHDQKLKARRSTAILNIAEINRSSMNDLPEILLGHLFVSSISLDALAYTFVI